jgi:predicted nucleic acid binding AN1-type Zn finger protein
MRCKQINCEHKAMQLIGKCNGCNVIFCHIHRYPEEHKCLLTNKKEDELKRLSDKLHSEATKKVKINF